MANPTSGPQRNRAGVGELCCVREKVVQDLLKLQPVTVHVGRQAFLEAYQQIDVLVPDQARTLRKDIGDENTRVEQLQ